MKRTLLFLILISIFFIFYKCSDSGVETPAVETYEISGTISNWTYGTKILKAIVTDSMFVNDYTVDSAVINPDGSFKLKLKTPPDNYLSVVRPYTDSFCTSNVQISPAGLKSAYTFINVFNDTNAVIGGVAWKNYDSVITQGSFWGDYLYYNSDANITGAGICYYSIDTIVSRYNLTGLKKGWNKIVVLDYIESMSYNEIQYNLTEPAGGRWYFQHFQKYAGKIHTSRK